ncbi:MAG: hypothetical protein ACPL5I_08795 [Thermodesulfobacteriota bacterium]
MRALIIVLAAVLALTLACAPSIIEGRKIDPAKVKKMEPGVTKVSTVEELFGKPDKVERLPTGEEMYVYGYEVKNPHWWTVDQVEKQRLEVILKNGVVQYYKLRTEGKEVVLRQ